MGDAYQAMLGGDRELEDGEFRSSGASGSNNPFTRLLRMVVGPGPLQKVAVRFRVLLDRAGISTKAFVRGVLLFIVVVLLIVIIGVAASPKGSGGSGGETRAERDARRAVAENNKNIFFNAHHSPIGAFSSFTVGGKGSQGGLGLGLAKPADQDLYILLEAADTDHNHLDALPFFPVTAAPSDWGFFSQMGTQTHARGREKMPMFAFPDDKISRTFELGTDSWVAGDLTFTVYSQARGVPDPNKSDDSTLKLALVPAVLAEITVDNSRSDKHRKVVFGYSGSDPYSNMRPVHTSSGAVGVGQGLETAIVTDAPGASPVLGFSIQDIVDKFTVAAPGGATQELPPANRTFALGNSAAIVLSAPPRAVTTYKFVVSFWKGGPVTSGMSSSFFYSKFFDSIESVAMYALDKWDELKTLALSAEDLLGTAAVKLSDDRKFQMRHSIRSYFGSTQLLQITDGKPYWVVNEGEYRMMNTVRLGGAPSHPFRNLLFDLTVDQLFFEMKMNPWTVQNVLDSFSSRYSFTDTVFLPGDPFRTYPGGISFTHDQGVGNAFSPPGKSSYEEGGLSGLFSQMTHEQLVNWVLCAGVWLARAPEEETQPWLDQSIGTFHSTLTSLVNRDHPDPLMRDGIMSADSSRTLGGSEITTYDSLDTSLGQARDNLYLGGKTFAAYVLLEKIFLRANKADLAAEAAVQAGLAATTMTNAMTPQGYIPAILTGGSNAKIIPAIEGLVYPLFGNAPEAVSEHGPYKAYLDALKRHLKGILRDGECLFPDGGWKLSSTSDNSWLSKIYLSQFVAHEILRLPIDDNSRAADAAHASWLRDPKNSYWSWSDQMIRGSAVGSRYYPRGVTSILWLDITPPAETGRR